VLYAAVDVRRAFAETFLREPGLRQIDPKLLARKAYVRLEVLRDLQLIDLVGPGLAVIGATAEIVHGGLPYAVPQAWSGALYGHPIAADGIAYHARHDDQALCVALFDRGKPLVGERDRILDLDADWFGRLLKSTAGAARHDDLDGLASSGDSRSSDIYAKAVQYQSALHPTLITPQRSRGRPVGALALREVLPLPLRKRCVTLR
jgi:hypothetical protein